MDTKATRMPSNPYILLVDESKGLEMRAHMLSILIMVLGAGVAFGQDAGKLGSISGRVVNSATGEGIRRADVVMRGTAGPMRGGGAGQTARGATTDAEGKFRFDGVEAGNYFLMVQKQGFVPQRGPGYSGRGIRVTPGQEVSGQEYKLLPHVVITGRVVDDEGEPVQGIGVTVLRRRFMNGKRRWMQSNGGATNDLGEFRIFNLPPGKVIVSTTQMRRSFNTPVPNVVIQGSGVADDQQYVPTYYPNAFDPEQATVIETKAGQTVSNVDIQLRRGTVYKITGRVTDPETQGPMRFGVSAIRTDDMMRGGEGASTKPDGTFEIRGVRPGSYTLTATTYDSRPAAGQRKLGVARVDVSGDVEGIAIEIKGGFKVSGTVAVQTANSGEKVNPQSVSVMLSPAEQGAFFGPAARVVVAADGTWSAENVVPGTYRLNALLMRSADGVPGHIAAVTVGGEDYLGKELDMTQGPVGPIRVVVSTNSGTINGTLDTSEVSSEGSGFAVAIPVDAKYRLVDQMRAMPVAQDGSFSIRGLRPGEYLVFAFDQFQSGALEDPEIFKQVEQKGVRVKVTAGQTSTAQVKLTPWPEEAMVQ